MAITKERYMVSGAIIALEYMDKNKNAETKDIINHVMKTADSDKKSWIYVIAAANEAIKIRQKNPDMNFKQISQMILDNIGKISSQVDKI